MSIRNIPGKLIRAKRATFVILILFGCGFVACDDKREEPVKSEVNPSVRTAFQSRLEEPWKAFFYQFDRWYDFRPDRYSAPDLSDTSSWNQIYKLEIRTQEQLEDLEVYLPHLQQLEALKMTGIPLEGKEILATLFKRLGFLPHFQKLILTQCGLRKLPEEIRLLKELRTLDLSFNELTALPEIIGELGKLEYIRVYNNRAFSDFPQTIGQLKQLLTLDFAGTAVSELPESLSHCQSLQHITGNACRLEKIPGAIGTCQNLKYINLAANQLRNVPESIGALDELESLSLGNNRLFALPGSFENCKNLRFLDLAKNRFSGFPAEVTRLPMLRTLWIHGNDLTSVPEKLVDLSYLTHLLIDESEITDSSLRAFKEKRPDVYVVDEARRRKG